MSRILVVDDDPVVARTLADLLTLHDYAAFRADGGAAALRMLGESAFDLVMLDLRMPVMDGIETCARIRERFGASLPVLMLTGDPDRQALRQAYESGADDFLEKPVDTTALILKVRAFLRLKSLHDETVRHRERAQARARDLALLHEIGRDWSLIAEPEAFNRMVTQRLAELIGSSICLMALVDGPTRELRVAVPAHGLADDAARALRLQVRLDHPAAAGLRSGRAYAANAGESDPRRLRDAVGLPNAQSVVLAPMISEGTLIGVLVAADKPGGFGEADVQLLSLFAGPAASFIRSRQIYDRERANARQLERAAALVGELGGMVNRVSLLAFFTARVQADLGYERVAFYAADDSSGLRLEAEARGAGSAAATPPDHELLAWSLRGVRPLPSTPGAGPSMLAVPVRAGERTLGTLELVRAPGGSFGDDDWNLLSTLSGQLAIALQRALSAEETERLAAQMATLYDLGLETGALRDLRLLFVKATEEAGRLIRADHASVLRFDEDGGMLCMFAAWARDPIRETYGSPVFRMGEGVAGQVARDRAPALVNDVPAHRGFVERGNPVSRLLCVPLLYYDQERQDTALFGVLNATRVPGAPPFTRDDLDYLTRFAGQLAIGVANSMAFAAERERSEQLALVNTLLREIGGSLSRERILEAAVRRIHEAFRYPVVAISTPDYERRVYRIVAVATPDPLAAEPREFPLDAGVTGRAYREQRTMLVPDVMLDPDYIGLVGTSRSEVAVPIFSGDEVAAVLNVESDVRRGFDRAHVITLETLADGVGILLRNAELYAALERTNAQLVELDRTKSELVNVVAHDFRAPLAGVLGHAELLEWRPDAPAAERVEQARAIIDAATHMASLVDKTLKTTRLEAGHFPFEFALVDLASVARQVVERMPADERHPLSLDLPEEPLPVWADRERIAEVVENLLSNAIKYSPAGGDVRVTLGREGDQATVSVRDQGIGIGAQDRERLFRPFSRVRDRRVAAIEGSGLGLYICDRMVRAHGGRVSVESVPDQGSVFSFTLPLYRLSGEASPLVLVATGDERTRREVRRVAERHGFTTHEVCDGVEAVEAALRLMPAAVVLDRVLPKLSAPQVAERLRSHASTEAVRLVALAGADELGDQRDLFYACVRQPVDPDLLAAALNEVVRSRAS
jgi:signal transduction histidine kinase/DNA-binding response OmpR family regulator